MFTGDGSGVFLYRALHKAGFANQPETLHRGDGLRLSDLYISAVCRCAPPQNKPLPQEISNCLPFLQQEMDLLTSLEGIVCLGRIAFDHTLSLYRRGGHDLPRLEFSHGAFYALGAGLPWLLASYHPSRQNTQTGRLTEPMFDAIWQKARELLA
jgi:uracil-DNA glycosylase